MIERNRNNRCVECGRYICLKFHGELPEKFMSKHHCHWPDCPVEVPPAMWGCKKHWFALPKHLRDRVWATYVPGQEITKTPSRDYLDVAEDVQNWINDQKSNEKRY